MSDVEERPLPAWCTVGAECWSWNGVSTPGRLKVAKILKLHVVTSDGAKWSRAAGDTLPAAKRNDAWNPTKLHPGDSPLVAAAVADARRHSAALKAEIAAVKWRKGDPEGLRELARIVDEWRSTLGG